MCYDLTSFLTTVASSSAGIVAILGGFIASKLISIDGERNSVLSRLKEIEKELSYHMEELDRLQKEDDEDEALNFMTDHLDDILCCNALEPIYQLEPRMELELEKLNPYWEKAIKIGKEYMEEMKLQKTPMNGDNIPDALVQKYHDCYFEYELLTLIGEKAERNRRKAKNSNNLFFNSLKIDDMLTQTKSYFASNGRYIDEENNAIDLLSMKKQLLQEQIPALKKPKGMVLGLFIFAAFSIACIIVPLALSPFTTDNLSYYNSVKRVILILFFAGLGGIFAYLVYLLHWKQK